MDKGRDKQLWNYTVQIIAKLHNVNCTDENDLIHNPRELHPYYQTKQEEKVIPKTSDLSFFAAILPTVNRELQKENNGGK